MKKTFSKFIFAAICIATFSCTSNSENSATSTLPPDADTVDLSNLKSNQLVQSDSAIQWKQNYINFMEKLYVLDSNGKYVQLTENEKVQGFTFRTKDLLAALGITKSSVRVNAQHIRAYFGIDKAGNRKMFFVDAYGAKLDNPKALKGGKDLFYRDKNSKSLAGISGTVALDLNYPCPSLCAEND